MCRTSDYLDAHSQRCRHAHATEKNAILAIKLGLDSDHQPSPPFNGTRTRREGRYLFRSEPDMEAAQLSMFPRQLHGHLSNPEILRNVV